MNKRRINESRQSLREMVLPLARSKVAIGTFGLTALMLLTVLVITSITWAQSSSITVAAGETLQVICEGRRFQLERASRTNIVLRCVAPNGSDNPTPLPPEPTSTSEAPPPPPEPTDTPAAPPEPTNTPAAPPPVGNVEPYAGAPACEQIGVAHNPQVWHSLWDYEHGCHWDHEHKHNPHEVDDIFGPPGAWFGSPGQEISYAWETPHENHHKHQIYGWIVRRDIPPLNDDFWLRAFRMQFHGTGTIPDTLTRYHSFSLEAEMCQQSSGQCGIVRTGGWIDFGHLEAGGNNCVMISGDTSNQAETCGLTGRRRRHPFLDPAVVSKTNKAQFRWYGFNDDLNDPGHGALRIVAALMSGDSFSNVDPNNPLAYNFFCDYDAQTPEDAVFDCPMNNSTIALSNIEMRIRSNMDPDGDGRVNFNGYTDRFGRIVEGCSQVSLDCIPLQLENMPVTDRIIAYQDEWYGIGVFGAQDFDISPPGEWWIDYPN